MHWRRHGPPLRQSAARRRQEALWRLAGYLRPCLHRKRQTAAIFVAFTLGYLLYTCVNPYGAPWWFQLGAEPPPETGERYGFPVKTVLLWTPFYLNADYSAGGLGVKAFTNGKCPVVCDLTYDRRRLATADAVLFHMQSFAWYKPHYRPPGQKYVFFVRESPVNLYRFYGGLSDAFNITMTYWRHSDVPVPVYLTEPVVPDGVPPYRIKYPQEARKRNVAWVVSNCHTTNRREDYARQLSKYIDVDIYGACGNLPGCGREDENCFDAFIPSNYKFYLAFENSVCEDYVTEKMFRTLETEIIPVVMGGTNYTRDAPPHSVINALDFGSPRELAEYLKWVGGNETAFLEYFQWKNRYTFRNTLPSGFCHMCELLHNSSWHKTYEDVFKWWSPDMCHDDVIQRISSSTRTVADRTTVLFASMLFMFCFNFRSSPNYYSL